jgi:hypothetical protein
MVVTTTPLAHWFKQHQARQILVVVAVALAQHKQVLAALAS